MTDQTESASDYAGLLRIHDRVGRWGAAFDSEPMQTAEATAAAIRALEAKAEAWKSDALRYAQNADFWSADRDRIAAELRGTQTRLSEMAGEVERLQQAIKRQASSARMGMDAATKISAGQLREAARLHAESQPAAVESERVANEMLTAEVDRLTSELAAARENEARYLWLREHGDFGCTEKDGYGGQQLRTGERLDTAVDAARRAGEGKA